MGLFGGGSNAAKKSSRELRKGINQASGITDTAYNAAIGRVMPTIGEARGYLTQGNESVLNALADAYGISRGDITGGRDASLGALSSAYGTGRGDVANSLEAQLAAINQGKTAGIGYYSPYIQSGQQGLNRATAMTTPGDTSFQTDPGYQFRVQQGTQGIQGSAAGKGGVLGGNTLKALENYRQGLASSEFGNIYNRNLGLAQMGLGASQGAAGLEQWAGGAGAAANQWAGNQNTGLAQWLGSGQANLYNQAGNNLAQLATGYGQNRAGQLGQYYGQNANLALQGGQQLTALDLARAGSLSDYALQAANASAAREAQQGNQRNAWISSGLGLLGTLGGAALSNPSVRSTLGQGISSLFGGGTTPTAGGTGSGGSPQLAAGYGWGSNNPWLTGSAMVY